MNKLKISLIHLDVHHGRPDVNRKTLLSLIQQSAAEGAQVIVAPELCTSGYAFNSRAAIAPFVETLDGPTVSAIRDLARSLRVYVCLGLALKNVPSGVFTNSAVAIDTHGEIVCRYDKINAESRWACPGNPRRDNTFHTPWGRVGILICSDTYYGLMPRVTALRHADLLLVPANWPPSGLDPRQLWRARAMENGLYLAACNRTGMDRSMDLREATSCVYDPMGSCLLEGRQATSRIFYVEVPLNSQGRLDPSIRQRKLFERRPEQYHDCYLNLRPIRNLTEFLSLPQPGMLQLCCVVPSPAEDPAEALLRRLEKASVKDPHLYLLASSPLSDRAWDLMHRGVESKKTAVLVCSAKGTSQLVFRFKSGRGPTVTRQIDTRSHFDPEISRMDFNTARLHMVPFAALLHPETAVASAKQGCDLMVAYHETFTPEDRLMAAVRTLEGVAVTLCTPKGAGIWTPPEGHQRWGEALAESGEMCHLRLDTQRIRARNFQDSIDFEVLLRGHGGDC
ncbi:carbon-nitrogen hydrolase family protein [Desulfosoma sp.]|uniref:carbon-nitrogen hydrolase family protein n=1 Tax=Desulfosoma sp. TaxID=2603217 RepID=UPI004049BA50